eukprot:m.108233 g.108233  ORF g.108233 m.108233 type:complete len:329 (+) comp14273_c1_seq1:1500-2486(+)
MAESAYASCALAILISMIGLWGVNLRVQDPTFIDAFWGLGFVMQALLCIPHAGFSIHSLIMAALVGVWGLRLARYLFARWRTYGPDKRYADLLKRVGGNPQFASLYAIFLAQGLAMWIVGLPIQYAAATHARLSIQKLVGIFIAVGGLLTESLADWQMAQFRANEGKDKTKVMDRGLWRYSRHPNFFGSCVFWWGVYLFAAPALISWPIIGPLHMTFLLLAVTGIPPIETAHRNDPAYQEYKRRTHMFIPWFPKTASASRAHRDDDNSASNEASEKSTSERNDRDETSRNDEDRTRSSALRRGGEGTLRSKFGEDQGVRREQVAESGL